MGVGGGGRVPEGRLSVFREGGGMGEGCMREGFQGGWGDGDGGCLRV